MTTLLAGGAKCLVSLVVSLLISFQSASVGGGRPTSLLPGPLLEATAVVTRARKCVPIADSLTLFSAAAAVAEHAVISHLPSLTTNGTPGDTFRHDVRSHHDGGYHLALGHLKLDIDLDESPMLVSAVESESRPATKASRESGSRSKAGSDRTKSSGAPDKTAGDSQSGAQAREQNDSSNDSDESYDEESSRPRPTHRSHAQSVVLGDDQIVVPADEYHSDNIVCIGGTVIVRGEVRGNIVVIGGVLRLSGIANNNVVGVGSRLYLEDGARLKGDVTNVAGSVHRSSDVRISGDFTSIGFPDLGRFATGRGMFRYLLVLIFWIALFSAAIQFLAVLVVAAIAPNRIEGALLEPRRSWVLAFFLGALVWVVGSLVTLILCVLLPLGVAFWIALHVALWMGRAAIYLHVGRGIGRSLFGKELSYFGSILMGFALFAIIGLIPCFGMVFNWMVSATGLGVMLLTRFGGSRKGPVIPIVPETSRPAAPPPPAPLRT